MNPEARVEMVSHAERALRRGELSEAVGLYERLCRAFPQDPGLALKLANLREMLQPEELQAIQASLRHEPMPLGPSSPVTEGERLFTLGDYVGAAAAYRRALQERPDSELIRERLVELFGLAQTLPSHSPTDRKLPQQVEPFLLALLDRVASRRRLRRD
jgi:tetratricopeptide (TPR) repeat protein